MDEYLKTLLEQIRCKKARPYVKQEFQDHIEDQIEANMHIRMSGESRDGKEHFKKLDMADYAKKSFGMFRGKETSVKMLVNNSLAGVIIDRFGKDVMMIPEDEEHFRVNVDVHVSKQFLGWVFSLGEAVKIIGPDEVVEQMRGEARRLMEQYGE